MNNAFDNLPASLTGNLAGNLQAARQYTDFAALTRLRAAATASDKGAQAEAGREVARQFEALFLQMMLKSMRDAGAAEGEGQSDSLRFYQDMFDKQIALDLAGREQGGIGLMQVLQRQLGGQSASAPEKNPLMASPAKTADEARRSTASAAPVAAKAHAPATPQQFVGDLWPHAQRAAEKLGVAPQVLIAQAALETGWGQKMARHADGRAANNLFGIKADARWNGEQVRVSTLEYRDGIARREVAAFRSYASVADSFDDFADFILNSPRYQPALAAADSDQWLQGLQQAGYATDPAYADKIRAIMQRPAFVEAVEQARVQARDKASLAEVTHG